MSILHCAVFPERCRTGFTEGEILHNGQGEMGGKGCGGARTCGDDKGDLLAL